MRKPKHNFKHDSNARNDERLIAVRRNCGMEGYGVYWAIIEMLRDSDGYSLKLDYAPIAWELHVSESLVRNIVEDYGLFDVSNDMFHSNQLSSEMNHLEEVSKSRSRSGSIGMKSRWGESENKPIQATQIESQQQTNPQQPKRRSKKYSDEETQLHSHCKEIFSNIFKQHKGTDYYWSAKDMAAIVGILKQIRTQMSDEDRGNLGMLADNFQIFIQMIFTKSDDWIKANASPAIIHSKFNEIYTQLKNGTKNGNKQSVTNSGNARDNIEFITRIAETLQSGSHK